jgi:hypothetical protein
MTFIKKTIAVIFMVLSVIAIIAMIVGLFGSWVVKAQVETTGTQLLLAAESAIATTRSSLVQVDGLLETSSEFVGNVDARFQQIGTDLKSNQDIVLGILDRVNADIVPTIERAVGTFRAVEANLLAINEAIDAVKAVPVLGLQARIPQTTKLDEVLALMENLRNDVLTLRDTIRARRDDLVDGKLETVLVVTRNLSGRISDTLARLAEADERLAETETALRDLRERLPAILTTITIILNLLFLLSLLAFISLFIHAYEYFKCTEDGLRGLMPGDCEAEKVLPAAT